MGVVRQLEMYLLTFAHRQILQLSENLFLTIMFSDTILHSCFHGCQEGFKHSLVERTYDYGHSNSYCLSVSYGGYPLNFDIIDKVDIILLIIKPPCSILEIFYSLHNYFGNNTMFYMSHSQCKGVHLDKDVHGLTFDTSMVSSRIQHIVWNHVIIYVTRPYKNFSKAQESQKTVKMLLKLCIPLTKDQYMRYIMSKTGMYLKIN